MMDQTIHDLPDHDRRRIGRDLLEMVMDLRKDPDVWAKVEARAAEIRKEAKTA